MPNLRFLILRPSGGESFEEMESFLFDIEKDPFENHPIRDDKIEQIMLNLIRKGFHENEAPEELYRLFGV
jgi:hypothetical protein